MAGTGQCHLSEVIESVGECPVLRGGRKSKRGAGGGLNPRVKMLCFAGGLDGELGGGRRLSLGQGSCCVWPGALTDAKVRQRRAIREGQEEGRGQVRG